MTTTAAAEFRAAARKRSAADASLLALLEEWHRPTQGWLDRPVAELERVIPVQPPDGPERRYTLHWTLDHLQEHEIHHRAQLNLYLRLMGIERPRSESARGSRYGSAAEAVRSLGPLVLPLTFLPSVGMQDRRFARARR